VFLRCVTLVNVSAVSLVPQAGLRGRPQLCGADRDRAQLGGRNQTAQGTHHYRRSGRYRSGGPGETRLHPDPLQTRAAVSRHRDRLVLASGYRLIGRRSHEHQVDCQRVRDGGRHPRRPGHHRGGVLLGSWTATHLSQVRRVVRRSRRAVDGHHPVLRTGATSQTTSASATYQERRLGLICGGPCGNTLDQAAARWDFANESLWSRTDCPAHRRSALSARACLVAVHRWRQLELVRVRRRIAFKVKVLVTINRLELGGTQLNALDFASQAQRYGIDSLLVGSRLSTPERGPSLIDIALQRSVDLKVIDEPLTGAISTRQLRQIANDFGPDLVHSYGGREIRAPYWGPCRFGSRPLVMTLYEMHVSNRVFSQPHLIVGTKYLEEEQRFARSGEVHLISPPVDLILDSPDVSFGEFLSQFELDPKLVRLAIVSRLADMKTLSISQVIRAVTSLDRSNVQLVIVGDGPDAPALRSMGDAVNRQLGRNVVVFTGAMSDPRQAYSAADVVLGMGGSAARALAFGKPLIVSGEFGWFRTFEKSTESMLFRNSFWSDDVDPEWEKSLVSQLRRLIDNPTLRTELGESGRAFAEDHFGLDSMTRRLVDVYRDALVDHARKDWFLDLRNEMEPAVRLLRRTFTLKR